MARKKGKKVSKFRTQMRKNRSGRVRDTDLTRRYQTDDLDPDAQAFGERVSGKGDLVRKRTVIGVEVEDVDEDGLSVQLEVDQANCLPGRVLSVHGLSSHVEGPDGKVIRCAVRRLLKTLSTDQRNVVAAGDRVLYRLANEDEGIIERVEPRRGILSRTSRGRQHVMVANVDQILIVASADQPALKPNLIDRMLVTAERFDIRPVIVINKIDLVEPHSLEPIIGLYSQLGYLVLPVSAQSGVGMQRIRHLVKGRQSAVVGQSGVGKSSILNAIQPDLHLRTKTISADTNKGRHTTTAAQLIPLEQGGYVVDTPGIRQFQLWDVIPEEVAGYLPDLRVFVNFCRFPDCTHTHEDDCGVKNAVADDLLDARRYESYLHMIDVEG